MSASTITAPPEGSVDLDESRDYVLFEMCGQRYAFPMELVQEIIRVPDLVHVPLGPPSLDGLANLRGRVLPVVSLRRCCGLDEVEHNEATRVIVVNGGATLGFVVDRVASVTSVEADRVEPPDSVSAAIRSDLLAGVVKAEDGEAMTLVLDVPALVLAEFATLREAVLRGAHGVAGVEAGALSRVVADGDDATLELVSFAIDGQEYALPIDRVQEIVQAPEAVSVVPNAEPSVLGVMDLRGRLLPVISLRSVFGLPTGPLEPHNRILVVSLDGGSVVGVVMDTVREVLRVPHELVAPLPSILNEGGRTSEVDRVCRLEDGRRLVSVLSAQRLFAQVNLTEVVAAVAADDGAALAAGTEEGGLGMAATSGLVEDELLVVFRVAGEEYGVDVDAVQEIIRVPAALARVPRTLDYVEGLVNLRGAVLPVVDLRSRLGIERGERDERQRIVVLVLEGVHTGLIVDSVAEVLKVPGGSLEAAPELAKEQARLVSRVANLPESKRLLLILAPAELLVTEPVEDPLPVQRSAVEDSLPAKGSAAKEKAPARSRAKGSSRDPSPSRR